MVFGEIGRGEEWKRSGVRRDWKRGGVEEKWCLEMEGCWEMDGMGCENEGTTVLKRRIRRVGRWRNQGIGEGRGVGKQYAVAQYSLKVGKTG